MKTIGRLQSVSKYYQCCNLQFVWLIRKQLLVLFLVTLTEHHWWIPFSLSTHQCSRDTMVITKCLFPAKVVFTYYNGQIYGTFDAFHYSYPMAMLTTAMGLGILFFKKQKSFILPYPVPNIISQSTWLGSTLRFGRGAHFLSDKMDQPFFFFRIVNAVTHSDWPYFFVKNLLKLKKVIPCSHRPFEGLCCS